MIVKINLEMNKNKTLILKKNYNFPPSNVEINKNKKLILKKNKKVNKMLK